MRRQGQGSSCWADTSALPLDTSRSSPHTPHAPLTLAIPRRRGQQAGVWRPVQAPHDPGVRLEAPQQPEGRRRRLWGVAQGILVPLQPLLTLKHRHGSVAAGGSEVAPVRAEGQLGDCSSSSSSSSARRAHSAHVKPALQLRPHLCAHLSSPSAAPPTHTYTHTLLTERSPDRVWACSCAAPVQSGAVCHSQMAAVSAD